MADDLDTPTALTTLASLAEDIRQDAREGCTVTEAQDALRPMSRLFGLQLDAAGPEPAVIVGWNTHLARALR
jgi:DALR domain